MKTIHYNHKLIYLLIITLLFLTACSTPANTSQVSVKPTDILSNPVSPTESSAIAPTSAVNDSPKLILATTTSTEDSGLLDFILPNFEKHAGVRVEVIAVGTGQALQLGKDGNADVLLVHARAKEDEFMAAGDGVRREDVMYNDFVIIGPMSDPAGIKGAANALEAFKKIAETQFPFISRGDDSGTHAKEKFIWSVAGIEPNGEWYICAGQGMGEVLTMSSEMQAYTLSDRATFLTRSKEGLGLIVLFEGDPNLFNAYGVIAINPAKNPAIQLELANQFINWLISVPTQELIASYGKEEYGQPLFFPSSTPWEETHGDD